MDQRRYVGRRSQGEGIAALARKSLNAETDRGRARTRSRDAPCGSRTFGEELRPVALDPEGIIKRPAQAELGRGTQVCMRLGTYFHVLPVCSNIVAGSSKPAAFNRSANFGRMPDDANAPRVAP